MLYKLLPNRLHLFVEPPLVSSRIDCDWIYGAAMLFRKAAFQHVRGFDPRILMYGEEMELRYRLRQAGWRIVFEPNVRVIHYSERVRGGETQRAPCSCDSGALSSFTESIIQQSRRFSCG